MRVSIIGTKIAGLGFAASLIFTAGSAFAQVPFVKTVSSEAECAAQDGSTLDLQGAKHCLVPVIPAEFQDVQYAGELRGVTECAEKQTRKTQIGDFCLIALEPIPAKPAMPVLEEIVNAAEETASN